MRTDHGPTHKSVLTHIFKCSGLIWSPAGATGVCVHAAWAPPVKTQAALSHVGGREWGVERGHGGCEPQKAPTHPDGLLADRLPRSESRTKAGRKEVREKSPLRTKKTVYPSQSMSSLFIFPPRVLRRDTPRILRRSYTCMWT